MNTIVIWDFMGEAPIHFGVFNTDLTDLADLYINGDDLTEEQVAQLDLVSNGCTLESFPVEAVKSDTVVIVCGMVP